MGESSQQGAHVKPILGGKAGCKGVKITFPFLAGMDGYVFCVPWLKQIYMLVY